jgi:hypothetical protein
MNYRQREQYAVRFKMFSIILFGFTIILLSSCSKTKEQSRYIMRVDMSKEHDAGRFKPESGDKIGLSGNMNEWKREELFLADQKGDWIFTADIGEYLKGKKGIIVPSDTLEFKFVLIPGDNREIKNRGLETIDIRKITLAVLEKKNPVFVFNEVLDERENFDVTFRVGMNNQKVLGFFRPNEGDRMIVSGSFCGWTDEGIAMKDEDGSGIYEIKIPVKQKPGEIMEYKFRILIKRRAILPNQGWETVDNRQVVLSESQIELPYAEFNDMRRVARFVINTMQLEEKRKFMPKKGDILQIKLILDGKEHFTDALFQVKPHTFETAMIIPLTVKSVKWQIVRNLKEDISMLKDAEVDLRGSVITLSEKDFNI